MRKVPILCSAMDWWYVGCLPNQNPTNFDETQASWYYEWLNAELPFSTFFSNMPIADGPSNRVWRWGEVFADRAYVALDVNVNYAWADALRIRWSLPLIGGTTYDLLSHLKRGVFMWMSTLYEVTATVEVQGLKLILNVPTAARIVAGNEIIRGAATGTPYEDWRDLLAAHNPDQWGQDWGRLDFGP